MDLITIILGAVAITGIVILIVANMTDNEILSTIGLIMASLGGLFLFIYRFMIFLKDFLDKINN